MIPVEVVMKPEWEALGDEIGRRRKCGRVRVGIEPRLPGSAIKDAVTLAAERGGFSADPAYEVARDEAERVLVTILTHDLAYDIECVPTASAREYVHRFLSAFASDARFFTNGAFNESHTSLSSWNPITDANFDTGIFVADANMVGFLWVEDED